MLVVVSFVVGLAAAALGPAHASDEVTAIVNVSKLNLRAGPGFAYFVLRVLDQGQKLSVLGRAADSVWIEVRLSDSSGGWVYASFVRTSSSMADLPVTEAAGGPNDPVPASQRYSLYMTISDNLAVVNVHKFPAEADVVVTLGLPDGSTSLVVATGSTDPGGNAQFVFSMPRQWPDGTRVTQNDLVLVASTADTKFSRTASIQYYP
jgi:uncharacterized protein YgiM (DUF1202 family)